MSVHASTWVWDHSQATGSAFVVLLAIAEAANSEGEESCQSVARLARMTRCSESTVHRAIRDLRASGEIVWSGQSPRYMGTNIYRIPGVSAGGVNLTGGVIPAPEGVSPVTPEPTTNQLLPQREPLQETSLTEARATPEIHPSRRMTPDWQPSVAFLFFLRRAYPRVNVTEQVVRFRNYYYANRQTSGSWEARLENWVSTEQERAEQRALNGTDDMGIPLAQRATSIVPGPAQPGDPNYFDPSQG